MQEQQIRYARNDGIADGSDKGNKWVFDWNTLPGANADVETKIEAWVKEHLGDPHPVFLQYDTVIELEYGPPQP